VYRKAQDLDDFAVHNPDLKAKRTLGKAAKGRKKGVGLEMMPRLPSINPYDQPDTTKVDGVVDADASEYESKEDEEKEEDAEAFDFVDEDEVSESGSDASDASDASEKDANWKPQGHYPPACTCAIGCWRLLGGKVEDDLHVRASWDDFENCSEEVVGEGGG
jgi:hypothetical protein